jgi:OmpA-OmpF porin, OOP family
VKPSDLITRFKSAFQGVAGSPSPSVLAATAFIMAGSLMLVVAFLAALVLEHRTKLAVQSALTSASAEWATVTVDGLLVTLSGSAPNEAARFRAINVAGTVVDSGRIIDALDAVPAKAVEAPRFSVEMLRNNDGVQLIGLLPLDAGDASIGKEALLQAAADFAPDIAVSNMLETADYPAPAGWNDALQFGVDALRQLPSAKVSVSAERVAVTAITDSEEQKKRTEADLRAAKPEDVALEMDVSAPRPVIAPFTLRFLIDEQGARFDACSADTDIARRRILIAGGVAGAPADTTCAIGLGVPTPRWSEAAEEVIAAVVELGGGSVTISDADITLEAVAGVSQATLDRVVGELEADLPEVFSLDASLGVADTGAQGPAEFLATLGDGGAVNVSGRLVDELQRSAVTAFAEAAFGSEKVKMAARLDPALPDGWAVRVIAGLQALDQLTSGKLVVRPDVVTVKGVTGSPDARSKIAQILSGKLGQGQSFQVDVRYDKALDPDAAPPPPQECADKIAAILAGGKIAFTPGSAEIAGTAMPTIAAIAEVLDKCPVMVMEIAGHTDSQGSDGGNQALSQARADAVLLALQGRRVDVSGMRAVGYGENNGTETGREANRRIEFTLLGRATAATADAPNAGGNDPATLPADGGPSFAPTTMTLRPKPRPDQG